MSDRKKTKSSASRKSDAAAAVKKRVRKDIDSYAAAQRARETYADEVNAVSASSLLAENMRLKAKLAALRTENAAHSQRARDAMLVRMVDKLIPVELKCGGTYQIEKACIHDDFVKIYRRSNNSSLHSCRNVELARVVFTFEERNPNDTIAAITKTSSKRYACWLMLEVSATPSLTFHYVEETTPASEITYVVSITLNGQDLDSFERVFHRLIHENTPSYIRAFSTRPVWAYILLAMLTYNEHVFDDANDCLYKRVRKDTADGAVAGILEPFASTLFVTNPSQPWEMIPRYLVRLMPREFALSINGQSEEDCIEFFIRQ